MYSPAMRTAFHRFPSAGTGLMQAQVRELRSQTPMEDPYMSLLDASMVAQGPIDNLFQGLGEDDEANLGDEGHDAEEANDDTEE
ncbi:hypothetical protein HAX54_045016 [Datura stramonium]|uniref:Uncharacterized protein n=1 Tax=Datura stramonium TaxID=4076 RepID=A0ABS8WHG9_DATST|nr:hypothetical protein [Datura stramonium]